MNDCCATLNATRNTVDPENPTSIHAHARIDGDCYGNAKTPHTRGPLESNVRAPTCARACVTVTSGAVSLDDLPGLFGVDQLHEHQTHAIEAAVAGRDVLLIVPTGSGKSLAFWGAGLIRGGVTLIVSPLRSLMADQYRRLEELGIPVRIWNSDVKRDYKSETLRLLHEGWAGFVYSTPESLKRADLSSALTDVVATAVIDEAHCVLRDRGFRADYAWLGQILDRIRPAMRFACTATLPGRDRQGLIETLRLSAPVTITLPVARSNLTLSIVDRDEYTLSRILNRHSGQAGLIFVATVHAAKQLHAKLTSQGRNAILYYGKDLSPKLKKKAQDDFMSGRVPLGVVTDAFLLGVDHSSIRFIVHYDHPQSIENWCQGFGRAGRDGRPAFTYGCFKGSTQGRESRRFLLNASYPAVSSMLAVWEHLIAASFRDETADEIATKVIGRNGKHSGNAILTTLKRYNLADSKVNPNDRRKRLYTGKGDFDAVDWSEYEVEAADARTRFDQLCELACLPDDRIPAAIDEYFGDDGEILNLLESPPDNAGARAAGRNAHGLG